MLHELREVARRRVCGVPVTQQRSVCRMPLIVHPPLLHCHVALGLLAAPDTGYEEGGQRKGGVGGGVPRGARTRAHTRILAHT